MPSIQHIAKRLSRVSRHPAALEVFGATSEIGSGHYFRRNVLKPLAVSALEARLGVRLPLEYVELLTTIGYGVGPYYGLYSPGSITSEMADLSDEGEPTNPAKDFPIGRRDLNELLSRIEHGSELTYIDCRWPTDGCIPICFQGCTFWTVLITAGEFTGSVWDVGCYVGWDGHWVPARRVPGIRELQKRISLPTLAAPPTLIEWYEAWLESIEYDIGILPSRDSIWSRWRNILESRLRKSLSKGEGG